jgi:hypothetical protein
MSEDVPPIDELLERAAAKKDSAKHHAGAPLGYHLRGVSTLKRPGPDGEVILEWVKTAKERDPAELLRAFREAIALDPIPPAQYTGVPLNNDVHEAHRLAVYPMGDPHLGMLSWPEETGDDFNLNIARANLSSATDKLVYLAPPTRDALLVNLGDYFHADNPEAVTKRSGNSLDVDSRWAKVLSVGVRLKVDLVKKLRQKHARVWVFVAGGNHDDQSAVMLRVCLAMYFENDPGVIVDASPSMFHYHRFGANLIGITHGHTVKAKDLPLLMAADRAQDWGATRHRYWLCGHVHHESVKEYSGCKVETFNTLAAKDAWHHGAGYRADRKMVCDVYHREHGRVLRHEVGVEQL